MASGLDKYPNFAGLAQNETLNEDYRIQAVERNSSLTLFAIHGGSIEPGSDQLARLLADDHFNLYIFEGLKTEKPFDLHITATHFDEPQALKLAAQSESCVSIHGYIGDGSKAVCVGGNDKMFAENIVNTLKAAKLDFEVIYPCLAYPATHPKNIVNRCANKGVQLEISQGLWDEMAINPSLKAHLTQTLIKSLISKSPERLRALRP